MKLLLTALVTSMMTFAESDLTVGQRLPDLKGEYLTGRTAVLPGAASGRVALLLFGFSYDSRFDVEAWAKRFREEFGKNPQVTFYEIPMIGGMARLGKWFIDSGMRRGTPKEDHENVITVYGGSGPWKHRLGVKAEDHGYLVLLDQKGTLAWSQAGPFEEARYAALAEQVRKLLPVQ
jgi:hypothetical protein